MLNINFPSGYTKKIFIPCFAICCFVQVTSAQTQEPSAQTNKLPGNMYLSFGLFSGKSEAYQLYTDVMQYDWVRPMRGISLGIGKRTMLDEEGRYWLQWGFHFTSRRFSADLQDTLSVDPFGPGELLPNRTLLWQRSIQIPLTFHGTFRLNDKLSFTGFAGPMFQSDFGGKQFVNYDPTSGIGRGSISRGQIFDPVNRYFIGLQGGAGILWKTQGNHQIAVTPYFEYGTPLLNLHDRSNPWYVGLRTQMYISFKR